MKVRWEAVELGVKLGAIGGLVVVLGASVMYPHLMVHDQPGSTVVPARKAGIDVEYERQRMRRAEASLRRIPVEELGPVPEIDNWGQSFLDSHVE